MAIGRRDFIVITGSAALASAASGSPIPKGSHEKMYGLIGKMIAAPMQRDALISILLEAVDDMPGCLSYVVAKDPVDPDGIWITEVWDSEQNHQASLTIPAVKQAISRAKPLIAGFSNSTKTEPVGGHGLATKSS
jgi:quinol monooxygenase YgiN